VFEEENELFEYLILMFLTFITISFPVHIDNNSMRLRRQETSC